MQGAFVFIFLGCFFGGGGSNLASFGTTFLQLDEVCGDILEKGVPQ